jgi:hypothetical protein
VDEHFGDHWLFGDAIIAVTNVADSHQVQRLAEAYPHLDPSAKAALEQRS